MKSDPEMLLRAVMSTRVRDGTLVLALVDSLLENMPAEGDTYKVEVHFRTRYGRIEIRHTPTRKYGVSVLKPALQIVTEHQRDRWVNRFRGHVREVDDPELVKDMVEFINIFK